ncbi:PepSY-like domain-containing protein [candidate division KSB1 bacterium]|nr:PepSY-like domain-containing protein [candidate division KSB1 bacterium]
MKRFLFCLTALAFLFIVGLPAEESIHVSDLPAPVLSAFQKAYPNAKIKEAAKEEEDGQVVYEIESEDGKQKRDILYAADGTLIELEEAMPFGELPAAVKKAVTEKYPDAKVEKAEKLTKGSTIQYEVSLEDGDQDVEVVLDAQGNIIHAEASNEGEEDEGEE